MRVEEKYKELKNGELDTRIQDAKDFARLNQINKKFSMGKTTPEEEQERLELKAKLDSKDKDYLRELDEANLQKIKDNMPKVANVFELKENLILSSKDIKDEIIRLDRAEKANEKLQKLEKEKEKLDEKWFDLDKKIQKAKNKPEEVKKIFEEQENLKGEFEKNEEAIDSKQKELEEIKQQKNNRFKGKSKDDLAKISFEIGQKISMCNVAAKELMNGKDIGDIDLDKNINGRKFDSKSEIKSIISSYESTKQQERAQQGQQGQQEQGAQQGQQEQQGQQGQQEQGQIKASSDIVLPEPRKQTFLDRHPRIASFVNKVKGFFNKTDKEDEIDLDLDLDDLSQKILENGKKVIEEDRNKQENQKQENQKQETLYIPDSREEFKNFLRESAEKGMKEASKDSLQSSDVYARLQANKFKAILRQDQKDKSNIEKMRQNGSNIKEKGQDYSDRSGDIIR